MSVAWGLCTLERKHVIEKGLQVYDNSCEDMRNAPCPATAGKARKRRVTLCMWDIQKICIFMKHKFVTTRDTQTNAVKVAFRVTPLGWQFVALVYAPCAVYWVVFEPKISTVFKTRTPPAPPPAHATNCLDNYPLVTILKEGHIMNYAGQLEATS